MNIQDIRETMHKYAPVCRNGHAEQDMDISGEGFRPYAGKTSDGARIIKLQTANGTEFLGGITEYGCNECPRRVTNISVTKITGRNYPENGRTEIRTEGNYIGIEKSDATTALFYAAVNIRLRKRKSFHTHEHVRKKV